MTPYICPDCQNHDIQKIGFIRGQAYCRACLAFQSDPWTPKPRQRLAVAIQLEYGLTPGQMAISEGLIHCYRRKQSAMIDAVTGSGKTEIVFGLIQVALADGKRVGFVIPRRDVVTELQPRFAQVFPSLTITMVFGGHHDQLEGDLVILTTHQIYRYHQYFDVLIFDEVDAFPYAGNPVLKAMVLRACCGMMVYLSATFSQDTLRQFRQSGGQVFQLLTRFHGHPLPLMEFHLWPFLSKWFALIALINPLIAAKLPVLIFVPTIDMGKKLYWWLKRFYKQVSFAYAAQENRHQMIQQFKRMTNGVLISTSILERGITLTSLQVVIFAADHPLYAATTLIQMAGRVGRKKTDPSGRVIVLADRLTEAMKIAQEKMRFANAHL